MTRPLGNFNSLLNKSHHCVPPPPPAHRAILRRARQEELQQLQNVPVVPTRLRRGALWGRTGPPDPVLPRRLRQPVAPIQSQHQLCGLLLHHTEAFEQGEQVHRLPRLLGVKTKTETARSRLTPRVFGWGECASVAALCERLRMHVNVCASVLKLYWTARARFATCSFWWSETMWTIMQINMNIPSFLADMEHQCQA